MPPRPNDDEYDFDFLPTRSRDDGADADEFAPAAVPSFGFAPVAPFSAKDYVASLFRAPLFGLGSNGADVPDLETAARRKLETAGFYGETVTRPSIVPVRGEPVLEFDPAKPPSWKFPGSIPSLPATILGDDTAFGPGDQSAPPTTPATIGDDAIARPDIAGVDNPRATPAIPGGIALAPLSALSSFSPDDLSHDPNPPPSLDHPDARTGVALTAADMLLKRGAEVLTQVAGGNREIVKQALDAAVAWIGSVLPQFKASIAKSGALAQADAERRLDERDTAGRNAAALRTLTERRGETEHAHDDAVIAGDPTRLEETRRAALDAFRAERLARGDGHGEVNTAVRAREAELRRTSLRHRLAQRDDAGIDDLLANDPDAKADPAAARAAAAEIHRLRREDPARAGEASIEREIQRRRHSGLIQSDEDAARVRHALRWEAQARRGIPEDQRRLLTNDERAAIMAEYQRREAQEGRTAAETWISKILAAAGSRVAQISAELRSTAPERVEREDRTPSDKTSPHFSAQTAESPKGTADGPADRAAESQPGTEDSTFASRVARHRAKAMEQARSIGRSPHLVDGLIDEITRAAEAARDRSASIPERSRMLGGVLRSIEAAAKNDLELRHFLIRAAKAAFSAATDPDADIEGAVLKSLTGTSPVERAEAEVANDVASRRRERQRQADERFRDFTARLPNAGYRERLAAIASIARETGALPDGALPFLMPDLTARDKTMSSRLADPEKVLAQLEALRAIAESETTAVDLPKSLRDLAGDYATVLRNPNRPLDSEQFVHAIFRRGVPRRAEELAEIVETAAEIVTPYGNLVSLNDARKAAEKAYDSFAAGRFAEGAENSVEAIWYLAMAVPAIGNARRGVKAVSKTKEAARNTASPVHAHKTEYPESKPLPRSLRYEDEPYRIADNVIDGADAQQLVVDLIRRDLAVHGLTVTGVKQIHTRHGRTDVDFTARTKSDQIRLYGDAKVPNAPYRNPQRKRQATLDEMYLFRADIMTGEIKVFHVLPNKKRRDYYFDTGASVSYEDWKREFLKKLKKR